MKSPALAAAAAVLPVAMLLAGVVSANPGDPDETAPPVDNPPPCCAEAEPAPAPADWDVQPPPDGPEPAEWAAQIPPEDPPPPLAEFFSHPEALPVGVVSEHGLQVKTILAARAISAAFPQITNMIGVRPDSQRWHPNGLAIDVMIPNSGSQEGVALGDQIVAFALRNADRFALQDAIWRGGYYTPGGRTGSGYGHYDHVHITTLGGGYPTGNEEYVREGDEPEAPPPPPDERPAEEQGEQQP